jgi:4-hydroxy-tetrahydrodipicolinate synthase
MTLSLGALIAPAATPVNEAGEIDTALLAAHCRHLLANGIDQVLLFGTTGEGAAFSAAQKCGALDAVIEHGVSPTHLLLGTGTSAIEDAVRVVNHAAAAGCPASLVLPPFFPKPAHEDGIAAWFAALAARTAPAPLLLYNIPQTAGAGFTAESAAHLLETVPSIVGLKDSSPGGLVAEALIARGFTSIYAAQDSKLVDRHLSGAAGLISATLDVAPQWARAALDGDAAAFERFRALSRVMDPYPLVWSVKVLLAHLHREPRLMGLTPPHARGSAADAATLAAAFDDLLQCSS